MHVSVLESKFQIDWNKDRHPRKYIHVPIVRIIPKDFAGFRTFVSTILTLGSAVTHRRKRYAYFSAGEFVPENVSSVTFFKPGTVAACGTVNNTHLDEHSVLSSTLSEPGWSVLKIWSSVSPDCDVSSSSGFSPFLVWNSTCGPRFFAVGAGSGLARSAFGGMVSGVMAGVLFDLFAWVGGWLEFFWLGGVLDEGCPPLLP